MTPTSSLSRTAGLLLAMVSLAPAQTQAATPTSGPLTAREQAVHLLNRFAFGATPALVDEVARQGARAWFEARLAPADAQPTLLTERLKPLASLYLDCAELVGTYRLRLPADASPKERAEQNRLRNQPGRELREAVLLRAVYAEDQVTETLADFWRNHFNICLEKDQLRLIAPDWERSALRAHLHGDFPSMLRATARHPAMLLYLDNHLSRRPATEQELKEIERTTRRRTGSRERGEEAAEIARQRGLNENYARELMELHTLGVDNGYDQQDVIELARILTGWSVGLGRAEDDGFLFRADLHCDGDKRLLGRVIEYDRKNPRNEGELALQLLATHPNTAGYLATKLCRHFLADEPPQDAIDRVATALRKGKGALDEAYRAIVADPEFFARRHYQAKFKRPFEFVVSALRVTGADVVATDSLQRYLQELCEPLYGCDDPTGYFDQAGAWCDPGHMAVRWRFAQDLAEGRIRGVRVPATLYADLDPANPQSWIDGLAAKVVPGGISQATRQAMADVLAKAGDGRRGRRQVPPVMLGLLLGSPEFQRQ